ncbi:MAG: AAA family ATPase, partial [Nannocystaceae bacterium]|nr:AAA family ATPase [Nannocystaceae bacterium]
MAPLGSDEEDRTPHLLLDESRDRESSGEPSDPRQIGRFEIIGRVGKGAMGLVFEAVDTSTRARVAIKMITRISPEGVYRFKREFRSLARFQHPNVVSLYELAQQDGQMYYTMELVRGVDVMRHLCGSPVAERPKRYRPCQDYDRLRATLRQLATGVDAIHRAGILHRDIKPSNVLVAHDGRVVLLDFGLVRETRLDINVGLTDEGAVLGTPLYMSPEQAVGRNIDKPSDWYGVGAIAYHALCGTAPFQGTGVMALLAAKRDEMPPRPREVVPDIPEDLDALCWDLIQTEQTARPQAPEILQRLGVVKTDEDDDAVSDSGVLIGRDAELEALHDALRVALAGKAVLALVDGVSGMGKSALVERFLADISTIPGTVVLSGKCSERESIPYKALDSAMDALSDYLHSRPTNSEARALLPRDAHAVARLFPVLLSVPAVALAPQKRGSERADPSEQRRGAFAALRELLGRLSDDKRLVIYIDDLQWSDLDSMQLLDAVVRHPDAPRMLVIGTFRPGADEGDGPLARLVRSLEVPGADVPIRRIHVGPIATQASTELALRMLGTRTRRHRKLAVEVAQEAEGSPFFVGELVRYARRLEAETESGGDLGQIVKLVNVIRHRIERLPTDARRLLDVIAVAGGRVSMRVAVRVAMGDAKDRGAVARLRAEHLVRTHGLGEDDSIEIYHDRIRETALKGITAEDLPLIHLEIGRALGGDSAADAAALSHHFRQAGEDQLATQHTIRAAEQAAAALAFDRAAELYRVALDLGALRDEDVPPLEARLGDALADGGHLHESAKAYLRASDDGARREHFEWTRRAAEHLLTSGHTQEGRRVLDIVLRSVGLSVPKSNAWAIASLVRHRTALSLGGIRIRLRHLADIDEAELEHVDACWTASRGLLYTDGIVAADFHARDLRAALKAGDPTRIARSVAFEAQTVAALGGSPKLEKAQGLLKRASELAEKV